MNYTANDLTWYGRFLDSNQIRYFDYSASGFEFCFKGTKAECTIISDSEKWNESNKGVLGIYIKEITNQIYSNISYWENLENELKAKTVLTENENHITLFESETEKTVVVKVIKLSEAAFGYAGFKNLEINGELIKPASIDTNQTKIEFIGDSITCGYGIEGIYLKDGFSTTQERADKAYAFLTAKKLNAAFNCISWSGIGLISNYVDPETVNLPDTNWLMPALWPYTDKSLSLRLGLEPEVWNESNFSPDIVVINIGTNDASFVRDVEERRLSYVSSYRQLLEAIHRRSPNAKIVCCLGVMGQLLCKSVEDAVYLFSKDFPNVKIKAVTFPVQDEEKDGIGADWHPTAKSHEKVAVQLSEEIKNWK